MKRKTYRKTETKVYLPESDDESNEESNWRFNSPRRVDGNYVGLFVVVRRHLIG